MGDVVQLRGTVKLVLAEEVAEALPQMLRDGDIEVARYRNGEPIYRLTEQGKARAAEIQGAAKGWK